MNVAIIAAAGRGVRMGGEQAKQFRALSGTPILIHTLRRFERCTTIGEVIVVVPAGGVSDFLALANQYALTKLARVVQGGETRRETVWRGLQSVRAATADVIAVHDGVRPFVTPEQIDATVRAAQLSGAAILAVPAIDTIKEVRDGIITRTPERAALWHAQTPQCFRYDLLKRAYEQAITENLDGTDDSALVERLGAPVAVIEGDARNIKITRPEDLALAEIFLKAEVSGQVS
ncbi:MAG TPA: 2-C-methyl-D-erythritol 4-phosphate cytidylyltransferase [Pyrinomonadaceae bacterium]|nr:2-C-methyl-D-erythritol 4-phosphate cytidylyltransferase [Pyrinomonadaceae bacterium]